MHTLPRRPGSSKGINEVGGELCFCGILPDLIKLAIFEKL